MIPLEVGGFDPLFTWVFLYLPGGEKMPDQYPQQIFVKLPKMEESSPNILSPRIAGT